MTNITELTAKLRHWASMASVTSERVSCLSVEQLTEVAEALEAAEERIAELEARTLTVKLPQRHSMLHRLDFDVPYYTEMVYKQSEVLEALAAAGIKLQIEGE